jgi:hypothetical protein
MMNREAIFTALFAKLQTVPGIVTFSRRFQMFDQYDNTQKPVLILHEEEEEYTYSAENLPPKRVLSATVFIFTATGQDPNIVPVIEINNILDAIDNVLTPDMAGPHRGAVSLGGLVSHCRIEGVNPKDDGSLDGNGVTIRKIKILVP